MAPAAVPFLNARGNFALHGRRNRSNSTSETLSFTGHRLKQGHEGRCGEAEMGRPVPRSTLRFAGPNWLGTRGAGQNGPAAYDVIP